MELNANPALGRRHLWMVPSLPARATFIFPAAAPLITRSARRSVGSALSATLSAPLSPLFGSPKPKPTQPTSQPSSPDRAKELFGKFGQSVGWAGRWDTPAHTECMTIWVHKSILAPHWLLSHSLSLLPQKKLLCERS